MAHTTRRLAGSLAALALVVGGCGDDDASDDGGDDGGAVPSATDPPTGTDDGSDDGSDPAGIDPCSLLTPDEVESVLGVPAEARIEEQLATDFQQVCAWFSDDLVMGVQVLLIESGPVADFDGQRGSAVGSVDPVVDIDVPGADRAYSGADASVVGMEVDDSFLQLANVGQGAGEDVVVPLAEIAAGRLRDALG